MPKYIWITFGFLGWAFFEMSGGVDFQPRAEYANGLKDLSQSTDVAQAESVEPEVAQDQVVTRMAMFDAPSMASAAQQDGTQRALEEVVLAALRASPENFLPEQALMTRIGTPIEAQDAQTPKAEKLSKVKIAPHQEVETPEADLRKVTGNRVNMRVGPGQNFAVLGKLGRGDKVEVLRDTGNGWVKLRVQDSGRIGWMADFLLTKDG